MKDYFFKGTWNSFGEGYHLALHGSLIAVDELRHFGIIPNDDDKYANALFEFLEDLNIEYGKSVRSDDQQRGLSEISNTIFNRFHNDLIEKKQRLIKELAKKEGWELPFESEFRDPCPKVLIWQRTDSQYETWRNSTFAFVDQLVEFFAEQGFRPFVIGGDSRNSKAYNLGDCWSDGFFKSGHLYCKQLWFQNQLFEDRNVRASLGMMSGGMDGAAMFFGCKTIFFAREDDAKPRMAKVAAVIPGLTWFQVEYPKATGLVKLSEEQLSRLREMI